MEQVRKHYKKLISENNFAAASKLVWEQFKLIHEIVQTLDDIYLGTIDVIEHSKAAYLEIRTTPKNVDNQEYKKYIEHFVAGIKEANDTHKNKKIARGILSLDRTLHDEKMAIDIINECLKYEEIVGIDISGDPYKKRTLTDEALEKVLRYALDKPLGIALHAGEVASEKEAVDTNIALKVFTEWKSSNLSAEKNPLHGKVRIGHGIYLTPDQQDSIRSLGVPVEKHKLH